MGGDCWFQLFFAVVLLALVPTIVVQLLSLTISLLLTVFFVFCGSFFVAPKFRTPFSLGKDLRRIVAEVWDTGESLWVLQRIRERPVSMDHVVAFKALIVMHRVLHQGGADTAREWGLPNAVLENLVTQWEPAGSTLGGGGVSQQPRVMTRWTVQYLYPRLHCDEGSDAPCRLPFCFLDPLPVHFSDSTSLLSTHEGVNRLTNLTTLANTLPPLRANLYCVTSGLEDRAVPETGSTRPCLIPQMEFLLRAVTLTAVLAVVITASPSPPERPPSSRSVTVCNVHLLRGFYRSPLFTKILVACDPMALLFCLHPCVLFKIRRVLLPLPETASCQERMPIVLCNLGFSVAFCELSLLGPVLANSSLPSTQLRTWCQVPTHLPACRVGAVLACSFVSWVIVCAFFWPAHRQSATHPFSSTYVGTNS